MRMPDRTPKKKARRSACVPKEVMLKLSEESGTVAETHACFFLGAFEESVLDHHFIGIQDDRD